jgi:hypothetical protein
MPAIGFGQYDLLPEVIKAQFTRDEYAWLSDDEKNRLVENSVEPDYEEQGGGDE